ncbi:hypothetical protein DAPPUDRAFT_260043 [Daphnia pulex]|uniref:Uncharacterized protein n=1 Tax=Daphnia pulex TaxID=6669 RepID=E9HID7_DAPPU|nr:hypothetical protein DAPPUDRAFT_260043 [Daphnia pulex]|eukprot:EFX68482.1 hypothetical protein DAPPUDRAFT_260043 [Daphnia pulex]
MAWGWMVRNVKLCVYPLDHAHPCCHGQHDFLGRSHAQHERDMRKRDGTGRTTGPRGDNINRPSSLDVFESTPYWISTGKGRTRATGPCSFAVYDGEQFLPQQPMNSLVCSFSGRISLRLPRQHSPGSIWRRSVVRHDSGTTLTVSFALPLPELRGLLGRRPSPVPVPLRLYEGAHCETNLLRRPTPSESVAPALIIVPILLIILAGLAGATVYVIFFRRSGRGQRLWASPDSVKKSQRLLPAPTSNSGRLLSPQTAPGPPNYENQSNVGPVVDGSTSAFGRTQEPHRHSVSRLEDSATQTQVEESFFSENKDGTEIQLSSAGVRLGGTESELRRRRMDQSRQRYSDDSGSESDDEQHLPGLRYHQQQQQQRPNLSQYVSDGGAPWTGGSGGDGSSHGLSNIKTVHLEPLVKSSQVATDLAVRSQSILSNVGTESSVVCPPADGDSSAQRADQVQSGNSHFRHPRRSSQNPKRKIFQQLLDWKQMQIRIGQANEHQVFAKRLIDGLRKDAVTVGIRPYDGSNSFQQLQVYLFNQLRLVQGGRTLLPLVDSATDREDAATTNGLKYGDVIETESANGTSRTTTTMPVEKGTHTTQRCPHAMYACTTLPPALAARPCPALPLVISRFSMDVVVEPIDFDSFEAVPYHKHHRPVTQQHQQPQQPTNHPGTAKLTTENGRIFLPKLNLNNNINGHQKSNAPANGGQ